MKDIRSFKKTIGNFPDKQSVSCKIRLIRFNVNLLAAACKAEVRKREFGVNGYKTLGPRESVDLNRIIYHIHVVAVSHSCSSLRNTSVT